QYRGLGPKSTLTRNAYSLTSGQEYRSGTYGHLNLYGRDELVLKGEKHDANNWPLYGSLGRDTQSQGGYAWYAHGGYAQAIYADFVQGDINAVELLQFGIYRGIGLEDWYHILNVGYRFPAIGASDFPACRKMSDCLTYVHLPPEGADSTPGINRWLEGAANGQSYVSTGPALLLEVDGKTPGAHLTPPGAVTLPITIRLRSEIAPVTTVQLIANGEIVETWEIPLEQRQGRWLELSKQLHVDRSTWIAARAFSKVEDQFADAESHTNPVYVDIAGRAPYVEKSLDAVLAKLDGQLAIHRKREFPEKSKVLTYFERSRDMLLKIRELGGLPADQKPWEYLASAIDSNFDPTRREHGEEELKAYLKPVPPLPIAEAQQKIEIAPGFELQIVAAEPDVLDPVAAAIDEQGRMYVAEMRDYPYFPKPGDKPIGTVRLLRDTDGDGRMDRSTIFADELLWAAGIAPWKGGVFVTAPPDIWYFKDTDGDDRADIKRKVFTGFGKKNQQAMLNNLKFGLDHRIYGATAHNGGDVVHADRPDSKPIPLTGHDFRFDPVSESLESISGTIQFGNSFDDFGNRFLCSESDPLLQAVLPEHYLARNPYVAFPRPIQDISGGSVPIHRISPVERWRAIRSGRRVAHTERRADRAGASHHVLDAGAGVTIYRGGAFPSDYYGDAFIGDAQNNLIHRMKLVPDGVTFKYQRVEQNTEFARSSDTWFRPVNFLNAPDGTLYCLDMSREIIESIHIPNDVVKFLDLKNGRQTGRIYRIAPTGFQPASLPNLAEHSTEELVCDLKSPHGWIRETAHRLLYERQDQSVVPQLRELLTSKAPAASRLHALWTLKGLEALHPSDLLAALNDEHPALREHALQLIEPFLKSAPSILPQILTLADDPSPRVRFQLAFTLGESSDPLAATGLVKLFLKDSHDSWIRAAILSSAVPHALPLAEQLFVAEITDQQLQQRTSEFVSQLVQIVGAGKNPTELNAVVQRLLMPTPQAEPSSKFIPRESLLLPFARGLNQSGLRLTPKIVSEESARQHIDSLLKTAIEQAANPEASEAVRYGAIQVLATGDFRITADTLTPLFTQSLSDTLQSAILNALAQSSAPEIGTSILASWRQLMPSPRQEAIRILLSRDSWTIEFLKQGEQDASLLAQVDNVRRGLLRKHHNSEIKSLAEKLFSDTAPNARLEVLAKYQPALELKGNPMRGGTTFERECSACHKVLGKGTEIGPNIASSASRDSAALLKNILDPNQYVLPQYEQYVVVDKSGAQPSGNDRLAIRHQHYPEAGQERNRRPVAQRHRRNGEYRKIPDAGRAGTEDPPSGNGRPD
ncbi:MAG: CehA/McbA family metallohydrolase, partial [Planctomycetaceae bacterium]|nr:CehA/McbA family metallohydrolase [Planctomycetaceae bacterium]